MEDDNYSIIQLVTALFTGGFLIISEILPFVSSVKSNGLLDLLMNTYRSFFKSSTVSGEQEGLLQNSIENRDNEVNIYNISTSENRLLTNKMDQLNGTIIQIFNVLNEHMSEIQHARGLKLQSIELYELNYIINYIKVNYPKKMFQTRFLSKSNKQLLISQGYIVNYDSQTDTHIIKW